VKALSLVLEQVAVVDMNGNKIDLESVLRGDPTIENFDDAFDASSDEENFEADE